MKLTYEAHQTKVSIETRHDDVDIEEMYELVKQLLGGAGFHTDTIDKFFKGG